MLQIVTGMYFPDVPVHETIHRDAFYTNAWCLSREPIDLPIGRFEIATPRRNVSPVVITATERLPKLDDSGATLGVMSTGGSELLDDAAAVFAFSLNICCSRSLGLMEKVIPPVPPEGPTRGPCGVLRRTFDPAVQLLPHDVVAAREFCTKLVSLQRPHFEAAMKAIRGVADSRLLVAEDPSLAYTLFVAALESLAQITIPAESLHNWDTYEAGKKKTVETAISDGELDANQAALVRSAVLTIDQLSLTRRFTDFVLSQIRPSFYRSEATAASGPIRAIDLPEALRRAYNQRSRQVHTLETLTSEQRFLANRSDTFPVDGRTVLTLEGMSRLCQHVIASFVDSAPAGVDRSFDYKGVLPNIVRVRPAPVHWIGLAGSQLAANGPGRLKGFLDLLCEFALAPETTQLVDMTEVLKQIEKQAASTSTPARLPLLAIYLLWHQLPIFKSLRRPNAESLLEKYKDDLEDLTPTLFAITLLTGDLATLTSSDIEKLVETRRSELRTGKGQPLPRRFDSTLLLLAAQRLWVDGRLDEATELVSEAVESLPGDKELLAEEASVQGGNPPRLDPTRFALGLPAEDPGSPPEDETRHGQPPT